MSYTENDLQRLVDENSIRTLVETFVDACIRADHDTFRTLWAEDGVWEIGAPFNHRSDGIGAIAETLHHLRDERIFFTQLVPTGVITIDGDTAEARWPVREVAQGPGETYYDNLAMYFDSFVRIDGVWKFSRRSYKYMWLNTEKFDGTAFGAPVDN
ncbi:nuclear transport factor 2 family protein [Microbacterium sp. CGR1]|uniref:nuclear transport factor 2 family protein n=1 Tax=Microbacterium sp. CGR1 TaxID=1696072 RepID=UPI00069ECDFE|nr:nuclear transport factor 2 family protein [Microbacterium sp. CGR1]